MPVRRWAREAWWTARAGLVLGLAACAPAPPPAAAPAPFAIDTRGTMPEPVPGECWHELIRPALYETVTQHEITSPRNTDDGMQARASLRSESHQREVRPRQVAWFRIPCPDAGTDQPQFTASLQRALKARGLYHGAVTGVADVPTQAAVRRYQAASGLDTPVLSLAAGQALGLIRVTQ